MANIFITGANGQLGRALSEAVWGEGITVHMFSRKTLDLEDRKQIHALFQRQPIPDIFINAAAYTAVDLAEQQQEQAFAVNELAVAAIAEECAKHSVPMIQVSTDYVFSGDQTEPYTESDQTSPVGVYGLSKLRGEIKLRETLPQHVIVRTSGVFGEHGHNFVRSMLRLYLAGKSLKIVDDQICCPTWTRDISNVLVNISQTILSTQGDNRGSLWGTYHFVSKLPVSWYAFTREIFSACPAASMQHELDLTPIPTSGYPTPAKRPQYSALNCDRIHQIFDIAQPDRIAALQNVVPVIFQNLIEQAE